MLTIGLILLLNTLLGLVGALGEFSCLGEDNLLSVIQGVEREEECDQLCSDTGGCVLYTWELYPTTGYCLLYSHCELIVPGCQCQQCSQCSTAVASSNGPSCDIPAPPDDGGSWQCTASPLCSSTVDQCSSLSCSLSCTPGRAPYPRSLSTCVRGSWSTLPDSIRCDDTRVLVTGGYDGYAPWTAEVWDPSCGNTTLPDLPDYRFYHSLDYADGKVMLCGGEFVVGPPIAFCLSLSPDLEWIPHTNLTTDRFSHASAVSWGQLRLLGGAFMDHSFSTESMHPAFQHAWSSGFNLTEASYTPCSVMIDEEQLVMLGGSADTAFHALLYNLTSGQSSRLEDMLVPRLGQHGCCLLRNETWSGVLVAGGVNSDSLLANAEVFDLSSGHWEPVGNLSSSRQGLVLVENDKGALAMGGIDQQYQALTTVEQLRTDVLEWEEMESLEIPRDYFAAASVPKSLLPCP